MDNAKFQIKNKAAKTQKRKVIGPWIMEVGHPSAEVTTIWNVEPENVELDMSHSNDFDGESLGLYTCAKSFSHFQTAV